MEEEKEYASDFHRSIEYKEIIGKWLLETRGWESHFSSPHYSPFGDLLIRMDKQHLIETIYHCINTIKVLEKKIENGKSTKGLRKQNEKRRGNRISSQDA